MSAGLSLLITAAAGLWSEPPSSLLDCCRSLLLVSLLIPSALHGLVQEVKPFPGKGQRVNILGLVAYKQTQIIHK